MNGTRVLVFLLFLSTASLGTLSAQEGLVEIEGSLAFDDALVYGRPNPLTLRITNRSDAPLLMAFEVGVESMIMNRSGLIERRIEVSASVTRQVTVLVPGIEQGKFFVQAQSANRRNYLVRVPGQDDFNAFNVDKFLFYLEPRVIPRDRRQPALVIGGRARQLANALNDSQSELTRVEVDGSRAGNVLGFGVEDGEFYVLDARDVPDTWLGYAAFRSIIWTEPDLQDLPNPAQLRALEEWVQFGGHLAIVSAHRPDLLSREELKPLLAAEVTREREVAYPNPLGSVPAQWDVDGPLLEVGADQRDVFGAAPSEWPSIGLWRVERRLGQGRLSLACFDPMRYDIGDGDVLLDALTKATGIEASYRQKDDNNYYYSPFPYYGPSGGSRFFTDLVNGNVLTPSLAVLFLLIMAYIAVIGPLDYVFLKKRGWLGLSPVSLLIYAFGFTAACTAATFVLFAPEEQINRIAILDVTEDRHGKESASGRVYHGLYAPFGGRIGPWLPPQSQCYGSVVTKEDGFDVDADSIERHAFLGPGSQPVLMRQPFNSFRAICSEVSAATEGTVTAHYRADRGILEVHNGLRTPFRHGVFVWENGVVEVQEIAPDSSVEVTLPKGEEGLRAWKMGSILNYEAIHEWEEGEMDSASTREELTARVLQLSSVAQWAKQHLGISPIFQYPRYAHFRDDDERRDIRAPWDMSHTLTPRHGVLMGMTSSLPFQDAHEQRRTGFTHALIRRVVEFPMGR